MGWKWLLKGLRGFLRPAPALPAPPWVLGYGLDHPEVCV